MNTNIDKENVLPNFSKNIVSVKETANGIEIVTTNGYTTTLHKSIVNQRFDNEPFIDYKLRREMIQTLEKIHKKGRLFWASINYNDLRKGVYNTSLGNYNKRVVREQLDEIIKEYEAEKLENDKELGLTKENTKAE
jgi:hypothetical protein